MKKHKIFTETLIFFIVFILFVCPSILQTRTEVTEFVSWNFPLIQFIYLLFSIFLLAMEIKESMKKTETSEILIISKKYADIRNYCVSAVSISALLVVSLIFQFAGSRLCLKKNDIPLTFPENHVQLIFCILTFVFSGGFEEIVFRYLLPESMIKIAKELKKEIPCHSIILIFFECFSAILFGLCHRYLGILAVINAVTAHFILRLCYKKTGSLYFSFLSHCIYNLVNVVILANF